MKGAIASLIGASMFLGGILGFAAGWWLRG